MPVSYSVSKNKWCFDFVKQNSAHCALSSKQSNGKIYLLSWRNSAHWELSFMYYDHKNSVHCNVNIFYVSFYFIELKVFEWRKLGTCTSLDNGSGKDSGKDSGKGSGKGSGKFRQGFRQRFRQGFRQRFRQMFRQGFKQRFGQKNFFSSSFLMGNSAHHVTHVWVTFLTSWFRPSFCSENLAHSTLFLFWKWCCNFSGTKFPYILQKKLAYRLYLHFFSNETEIKTSLCHSISIFLFCKCSAVHCEMFVFTECFLPPANEVAGR